MPNPKISIRPGTLEPAVLKIIDSIIKKRQIPALLDLYISRDEIDKARFTPAVRDAMIGYLMDRGVKLDDPEKVENGEYDGQFALTYEYAISTSDGEEDPIDAASRRTSGRGFGQWDFTVDSFDDVEEQGIVAENILAAGALDYIYELGERLGVFKIVDALVLNWSSGSIDVVEGAAATRLYRYWKRRDDRASEEERSMVYRRVLNKGDTEVLSRMVVNEPSPDLWHNLMSEVVEYVDKTERVDSGIGELSTVSRSRIYQATRELQYNLTEYCTGMAHVQAREFYAQLQECFDILKDPEIMAYFGGNRRKSMWTVIEKLSKEEFGGSPNIAAHLSTAVDGNKVFQWIAGFNEATVRQEEFVDFLHAAEAYILNFTTVTDQQTAWGDESGDMEDDLDFADTEQDDL